MWDLDVLARHQVLYSLHCREVFKSPALGCRVQVVEFVALASHGVCIAVGPNCSREQAFAGLATGISLVYVHGVVLFQSSLLCCLC